MKSSRSRAPESGSQSGRLAGLWADWGWKSPPREQPLARRSERRWRVPALLALLFTIPAFYAELLDAAPSALPALAYVASALVLAAALWRVSRQTPDPLRHARQNPSELLLILGLLLAATLPSSLSSGGALGLRLAVALLTLLRMVWALRSLFTRGGLSHMLVSALGVLIACGMGFWWLEPTTPDLGSGLWLAFTTATTVGYGDTVPTTLASKVFAVFVVLLGYGVLSLVTAAIASSPALAAT